MLWFECKPRRNAHQLLPPVTHNNYRASTFVTTSRVRTMESKAMLQLSHSPSEFIFRIPRPFELPAKINHTFKEHEIHHRRWKYHSRSPGSARGNKASQTTAGRRTRGRREEEGGSRLERGWCVTRIATRRMATVLWGLTISSSRSIFFTALCITLNKGRSGS